MGDGRTTTTDWKQYKSTNVTGKTVNQVYKSKKIDPDLDPFGVKIRESRDSDSNPNSTAIIVAGDVTGSMGHLAYEMINNGCEILTQEIYKRDVVSDPHLMFMGVGDAACDAAPLQVTQFEADIRIAEQLTKIWIEGGGGGNGRESYSYPWYFAALHTSIDCFEKRGKKGYLFTYGDDGPEMMVNARDIKRFLGDEPETDLTAQDLLTMVSRQYEVFHLMVNGSGDDGYRSAPWKKLLGERAINLEDNTKMPEVIISIIQSIEGNIAKQEIIDSWDNTTSLVVSKAIGGLTVADKSGEIVTF
jgi:hypothetical protein